jgi:hypothetical protein
MGGWGAGTFDGDSARDFLADMVLFWEQIIDQVLAGRAPREAAHFDFAPSLDLGESCLMPTVEIMLAVAEKLPCDYLPSPETVARWSEEYLRLYDHEIDGWDPSPGHKEERRQVIVDTFSRLRRLVESRSRGSEKDT